MKTQPNTFAILAMKRPNQDQIGGLSRYQIGGLSQDQIGWLSQDQREMIEEKRAELMKEIPTLIKPYTTLWNDIQAETRVFKQSTFGECEDFDPELNLCGSPMCWAGHMVNMGGKEGYELKKKYGWETAASLMHDKLYPTISPQNADNIPQEWALAYIEYMKDVEAELEEEAK